MAGFPGGDKLHIIYEGPPRVENGMTVEGDQFFLAGDRAQQARQGVELARGMSGILRPTLEYRYDTSANQPGSTFVDYVGSRREISCAINVFGDTPQRWRENWRRWVLNNPPDREGKLWFKTSDGVDRYAFVRPNENAGLSSIDIDPNILRKLEGLEWGWKSDYPYFFGESLRFDFAGGPTATVTVNNPSDVAVVYPRLYLPGPGSYGVGEGGGSWEITTPNLTADEVVRINFDPMRQTYVKRNMKTGKVTNLWYMLRGKRPELELAPGQSTHRLRVPANGKPWIEFTPMFQGAM